MYYLPVNRRITITILCLLSIIISIFYVNNVKASEMLSTPIYFHENDVENGKIFSIKQNDSNGIDVYYVYQSEDTSVTAKAKSEGIFTHYIDSDETEFVIYFPQQIGISATRSLGPNYTSHEEDYYLFDIDYNQLFHSEDTTQDTFTITKPGKYIVKTRNEIEGAGCLLGCKLKTYMTVNYKNPKVYKYSLEEAIDTPMAVSILNEMNSSDHWLLPDFAELSKSYNSYLFWHEAEKDNSIVFYRYDTITKTIDAHHQNDISINKETFLIDYNNSKLCLIWLEPTTEDNIEVMHTIFDVNNMEWIPFIKDVSIVNTSTPTWEWDSLCLENSTDIFRYWLDDKDVSSSKPGNQYTPSQLLSDGTHSLCVQEQCQDLQWTIPVCLNKIIDTDQPSSNILSPKYVGGREMNFSIAYSYTDNRLSTTNTVIEKIELWHKKPTDNEFSIFSIDYMESMDGFFEYTVTTEGSYYFYSKAFDNAGNVEIKSSYDAETYYSKEEIIKVPSDYETIQEALNSAKRGYTIIVSPGRYIENIVWPNVDGITLQGSLDMTSIIDGNKNGCVIRFESDSEQIISQKTLMEYFQIVNGESLGSTEETISGGGLYINNSSPSLSNLIISDNSAIYGAGIYMKKSNSTISKSSINNNSSISSWSGSHGGGIYMSYCASPSIINLTICNNTSSLYGGGIACHRSSPFVSNTILINNSAESGGGMHFTVLSKPDLFNIFFTKNHAKLFGGAIYFDKNQTALLRKLSIWENTANKCGGGIYSRTTIDFSNTQLCNLYCNYAPTACDIYSENQINLIVDYFTVKNPSNYHLSPIENFMIDIKKSKLSQTNEDLYVSIHGNDFNNGTSPSTPLKKIVQAISMIKTDSSNPRTIYIDEGVYDFEDTEQIYPLPLKSYLTLEGAGKNKTILNASLNNRIISILDKQNIIIKNLSIINGSETRGGGVHVEGSQNIQLTNIELNNNKAENFGGGLYFNNNKNIEMNEMVISNNEANSKGGGIYMNGSDCSAKKLSVTNNYAKDGGGMCISASHFLFENSWISENKASISNTSPGNGGGIYSLSSELNVSDIIITKNSAYYGCGFSGGNSTIHVSNTVVTENYGIGFYLNTSNAFLDHIEISNNQGDGIYCIHSSPYLTNMTIVNNHNQYSGHGLYAMKDSHPIIKNSILWNNQTPQIYLWDEYGQNSVNISYSVIQQGENGILGTIIGWPESNIENDPLLLNDEEKNNHLYSNSPCIDAGSPDFDEDGILWNDDISDQDPDGTRMDIGAYYFPVFTLHLNIPHNILENEGILEKRGEVYIKNVLDYDLLINLTTDNEGLILPETISINAGDQSSFFDIQVIDNDSQNESKNITVQATANNWISAEEFVIISDNEIDFSISNPLNNSKINSLLSITGRLKDIWEEISSIDLQISDGIYFLDNQYHFVKNESWIHIDKNDLWEFDTKNVVWSEKTSYTITALALEKSGYSHISSVCFIFQSEPDPISTTLLFNLKQEIYTVGNPIPFTLQVIPETIEQVDLTAPVNIDLILPDKKEISISNYNINKKGQLQGEIQCNLLESEGLWMIKASWSGKHLINQKGVIEGSESIPQSITITKAQTTISLNAPTHNIQTEEPVLVKSGHPISLGGKITTEPFCEHSDFSNLTISIRVYQETSDLPVAITTVYIKESGQFLIENYNEIKEVSNYQLVAFFEGNSSYASSKSYTLNVKMVPSAGYAILATGRIENNEGLESHQRTMSGVHATLLERGLMAEDILLIEPEQNSLTALEESIIHWAPGKMNEISGNLYLVLINHGEPDKFFIGQNEILSPELLNQWIDTLETSINDKSLNIVIVLGFCHSGSFMPVLSKNGRIVITSSAPDEYSYKGTASQIDAIRDGEYFVSEFFKEVILGKSIRDCFNEATKRTENYTMNDSITAKMLKAPYFDNALQHPLLDDNGDGKGSNEMIDMTQDGKLSSEVIIGVSDSIQNAPNHVVITDVSSPIFLKADEISNVQDPIWAKVNKSPVSLIWIEIKKPETAFKQNVKGQREMELIYVATAEINPDLNRYEWKPIDCFQTPGTYQIFYYALEDNKISAMKESRVYKAKPENTSPSNFQLNSPANNEDADLIYIENEKKYFALLDWQDSIDDGNVTYTVYLSDNNSFTGSNTIIEHNIQDSSILTQIPFGKEARYKVYWKITAIDTYGACSFSETLMFYAKYVGPGEYKTLSGTIFSAGTFRPIGYSSISVLDLKNNDNYEKTPDSSGRYSLMLPASGSFQIYISAINHVEYSEPFEFPEGIESKIFKDFKLNLKGDINHDNKIDLKDVIMTIQSIAK